jgi:hypothetical protein
VKSPDQSKSRHEGGKHAIVEVFKPTTSIIPAINIWLNAGRHIPGIIYCTSSLHGPLLSFFFFLKKIPFPIEGERQKFPAKKHSNTNR